MRPATSGHKLPCRGLLGTRDSCQEFEGIFGNRTCWNIKREKFPRFREVLARFRVILDRQMMPNITKILVLREPSRLRSNEINLDNSRFGRDLNKSKFSNIVTGNHVIRTSTIDNFRKRYNTQ